MKKYHHCVKFTYPLSFQTRIPKDKISFELHLDGIPIEEGSLSSRQDVTNSNDDYQNHGLICCNLYMRYHMQLVKLDTGL